MKSLKRAPTIVLMILILSSQVAIAITINPTYDAGFSATDRSIIEEAIREWTCLFLCGHTLTIEFLIDNNLGDLGQTGGWDFNAAGLPTSPTITIDYDAHNWTLGPPAPGVDDALDTLKHEIGHGLGFTVVGANFAANVTTVGGDRFYDLNGNNMFDDGDFDLNDDPLAGTHAPAGSGDLMQPTTPPGNRNHPTPHHAQILAHAYGYNLNPDPSQHNIPEPSGMFLIATGLSLLFWSRQRRRVKRLIR